MDISLKQALTEAKAKLLYAHDITDIRLTGGASDNRLVKEGDIFVCIKGKTVDGHDFAVDAMDRGASAILAERNPFQEEFGDNPPIPVMLVQNSVKALGYLANARRQAFGRDEKGNELEEHRVIGITGTAGKTSLKELIAHILSIDPDTMGINECLVAKNPYNNNTQIGLPIAILNATGKEKYWVLEVGISHAHDMDELGAILEPDIGIILNVGNGHTEGLGEKGVCYHKARFIKYIKDTGIAFVSNDYPELVEEVKKYRDDIIFFATSIDEQNTKTHDDTPFAHLENADSSMREMPYARYLGVNSDGYGRYYIRIFGEDLHVISPFLSSSGAENCLAACCVALSLRIPSPVVALGISSMPMPNMRFNRNDIKEWTIIDDTYNANPLSSIRMLENVKELSENKALFLLMGEMKELGSVAHLEHVKIGKAIAHTGIQYVFWVGRNIHAIQEGLKEANYQGDFLAVSSPEMFMENITTLDKAITGQKLILFKGSRSNHLEEYVKRFTDYCNAL